MPEDKLSAQHHQVVDTYHDPFADYSMTVRDTILRPYTVAVDGDVGGSIIITLPNVSDCAGRFYSIMVSSIVSPYTVTIQDQNESIEWTDIVLADGGRSYLLYSDGQSWITQNTELFRHKTSNRTIGLDNFAHVHLTTATATEGGTHEVFRAELTSEVRTGNWANAIVGTINYGSTGSTLGMAAAICAEMIPPDGPLSAGALYAMDMVFGCGASSTWGGSGVAAFMNFENWGTQAYFDDNAYWFRMSRVLEGTGQLLSVNAYTLRIRLDGSVPNKTRYVVLSETENVLHQTGNVLTGQHQMNIQGIMDGGTSEGVTAYFQSSLSGTATGTRSTVSTWTNFSGTPGSSIVRNIDSGIWSTADMTDVDVYGFFQDMGMGSGGAPNRAFQFGFNHSGHALTGWFRAENPGAIVYDVTDVTAYGTKGRIPFQIGDNIFYIAVYSL